MITKTELDMLRSDSVSVKTQRYFDDNGNLYPIGQPHRKAYVNSEEGRIEVENELEEKFVNSIFSVWGNEPTIFPEED